MRIYRKRITFEVYRISRFSYNSHTRDYWSCDSHFNFVFLSFDVDSKLFWTGKIGVAVITAQPWRFCDRSSDRQVMTGIELWASAWPGDDGPEPAGVVGVEATSPPSLSLSMAESSTNTYFLLLESSTRISVLGSGEKRKKTEKKRRTYSCLWNS